MEEADGIAPPPAAIWARHGHDGLGSGVGCEIRAAPTLTESRLVAGWLLWELGEGEGVAGQCSRAPSATGRKKKAIIVVCPCPLLNA